MYWIAALTSAAAVGVGGMFYLKHYFSDKEVQTTPCQRKIFIIAACAFYVVTSVLMALFVSEDDSTVLAFARDIFLMHCLLYLAVIDYKLKVIPNKVVLVMLGVSVALVVAQTLVEGYPQYILVDAGIGCLVAGGMFLVVNLLSRNGMGMGDVKLMAVAGICLGINKILGLIFWSLVVSVITGIILMIAKKKTIKSSLPLAPFFLIGSLVSNALYIISGISEV